MPLGLTVDPAALAAVCKRYRVAALELFGSRAKGTARSDSDVDLLVSFEPGAVIGLRFVDLAEELEALFGHPVDLLVRDDAQRDRNDTRRKSIFATTERLYAA